MCVSLFHALVGWPDTCYPYELWPNGLREAQATITATRMGETDFRIEMAGADGSKLLAFDVKIALHA